MKQYPLRDVLSQLFICDPDAGIFSWRVGRLAGRVAGFFSNGRRRIIIKGKSYAHSRLMWIYVYGEIPAGLEIDHIDGHPSNDRIENLRLATTAQQKMNRRCDRRSTSGLKGITPATAKGRWTARIKLSGKFQHLGTYDTPEDAHEAYKVAAKQHFGEFARFK